MLMQFNAVWNTLGSIIGSIPTDVSTVVTFVFCSIGVVGILRSL